MALFDQNKFDNGFIWDIRSWYVCFKIFCVLLEREVTTTGQNLKREERAGTRFISHGKQSYRNHTMPGVLEVNTDFPIKTDKPVHFGKVRAVYWLTAEDSARLIKEKKYDVAADTELAVMVISDRISAFDCIWKGEDGLNGVPGKVRYI